jgi:VanZ family protein
MLSGYTRYLKLLFFLVLAFFTILTLIPAPSVPRVFEFWDKAQHALAYAVLAVIGCYAFSPRAQLVAFGLLIHGALIEVLQSTLTTTRFGDVTDWFADAFGIFVGIVFVLWVAPAIVRRFKN